MEINLFSCRGVTEALSRWELGEEHRLQFREVTEGLGAKEIYVYPGLFKFMHDWQAGGLNGD